MQPAARKTGSTVHEWKSPYSMYSICPSPFVGDHTQAVVYSELVAAQASIEECRAQRMGGSVENPFSIRDDDDYGEGAFVTGTLHLPERAIPPRVSIRAKTKRTPPNLSIRAKTEQTRQNNQGPADGAAANTNQPSSPLKVTVKIIKDPLLDYGFMVSEDSPVCVKSVTAGGPGEGKLFPGDQILQINDMPLDTISQERIDNIISNQGPADGAAANTNQPSSPLKVTVKIIKDPLLDYGFMVSEDSPVCVKSVTAGGPGEGKLFPGDQILQINDMPLDTISQECIDNIIRECGNTVTVTVLRNTPGPKSSFITEEKRARLKSNPVKVHFAEEVIVNGQVQGNSLLLMPGILKVYLENGQTKAFRFEKNTTVKDIILSLKSKLSIRCIEHFALVLKERYTINKIYILHDDELIEQVVQKREPRDYRCLFRVCFLPRDPLVLLQDDPVTFEYLYSQSCNDVLLERFAMEMKYSTAIHLAALQIQECILSSNHSEKVSMKYIEMNWGIENFVSSTVLDNMKEKDIRKAINYHLKNNHSLIAPGQKQLISTAQVRLNYLNILSDLRAYGGKTFNATLLLQDSESFITLLVGAKYGISEVVNSKLNIINQLTDFNSIQKLELTFEYEKISVVNIYLVDVKSLTLVLETRHAKDLVCLIAGYHRLYVNSTDSIFIWPGNYQSQTTEEGPLTEENEDIENSESEATDSDCLQENIQEETSCSTGDVSDLNDEATSQGGDFCDRSCSADSMDELQMETSAPHSHGEISEDDDKDSNTEESDGEPVTKKHCTMELKDSFEQPSADSLASTLTLSKCFACFTKVVCSIPDLSQSENPCTAEVCNQCPRNEDDSYAEGDKSWNLTSHGLLTELPPAIDGDLYSEVLTIPILAPPPDEFFDAAEKVTHVEGSGDINFSGTEAELESAKIKGIEAKQNVQISPSLFGTGLDIKSVECIKGKPEEIKYTTTGKRHFASDDVYDFEGSILSQFKAERYSMPNGFHLIRNNIMELLNVLKEFPRESHIEEECAILTSSIKEKLYIESGKLMSACQKGIKVDQAPVEMLLGVSESFQALIQLTATCLQFTTCMHCAERHAEVVNNLKDVSLTYKTFVKISQDACSRKCDDLRMKLLAQQCNALTADVFCLTQSFK
ncbi:FERM and PDZ domain-containing protein 1-like [Hemiscyllium ocellatum]|uniref:FERM and PDZ domain-containing protein 1-like n=1 Tax=Hemiscyllium ocellatum TaxID=170820 RepID=UPI00296773BE|nr:FERM and PDZ domain-containing protein 1-like [Hemiscyllium ocellatum]